MLGDTVAAHFPASIPGRGVAKTGPGRVTRFQSAFPGARTCQEVEAPRIEVVDPNFGAPRSWKLPEVERSDRSVPQDIERAVGAIAGQPRLGGVPAPRPPWLETLSSVYSLTKLSPRRDTSIPLGIVDDPESQAQLHEYFVPDDEGNIVFIGAGGSGKSTALRSLAAAAAITPRGGVAHVYGIDFGGQLGSLEALPNVGSIVPGDDQERIARLIRFLARTVERRTEKYAAVRLPPWRSTASSVASSMSRASCCFWTASQRSGRSSRPRCSTVRCISSSSGFSWTVGPSGFTSR